jgi:hypothetical protein
MTAAIPPPTGEGFLPRSPLFKTSFSLRSSFVGAGRVEPLPIGGARDQTGLSCADSQP